MWPSMSDTKPTPPAPPLPSPRQTLSYLRSLFEAHGLAAKSKLGQNFLIDLNLLELLVRTAELERSDAVSVLVQSVADVEVVRKVLPTNFYPRPKVDSAIVKITPSAAKRAKVGDVLKFRVFLRDLYVHRRKNLRQALSGWPSGRKDKHDVDAKLAALGIDGTVRSEALDVEQHLRLAAAFG